MKISLVKKQGEAKVFISPCADLWVGACRPQRGAFIDLAWSPAGVAAGNDIDVALADSGLSNTTDTTSWSMAASEQMTGASDADTALGSYFNAVPSASGSAVATATGWDFSAAIPIVMAMRR